MGRRKRKQYVIPEDERNRFYAKIKKTCVSDQKKEGNPNKFVPFNETLALDENFQKLGAIRQQLLLCMYLNRIGSHRPREDFSEDFPRYKDIAHEDCFYYTQSRAKQFNSRYENSGRLTKDIQMLVEYGFIEIVYHGVFNTSHSENVYKIGDKWSGII